MTFDDYKFICFANGIDPKLIEPCRSFIDKNEYVFGRKFSGNPKDDLGYAELDDIDKTSIMMSTIDYDSKGRSLEKLRTRQLIKNPGKHLPRLVLKSFYLYYYDL